MASLTTHTFFHTFILPSHNSSALTQWIRGENSLPHPFKPARHILPSHLSSEKERMVLASFQQIFSKPSNSQVSSPISHNSPTNPWRHRFYKPRAAAKSQVLRGTADSYPLQFQVHEIEQGRRWQKPQVATAPNGSHKTQVTSLPGPLS